MEMKESVSDNIAESKVTLAYGASTALQQQTSIEVANLRKLVNFVFGPFCNNSLNISLTA